MSIILKSAKERKAMRLSGAIVAETLQLLTEKVKPGVTTSELDAIAYTNITKHGAIPSFKGYHGFPASICASVNEEVVHGIPGKRILQEGDILSLDLGVIFKGWHGDAAITVAVGTVSADAERLLRVTREALYKGIEKSRVGNRLQDIAEVIQSYAESLGFSVVRQYVGHGIGRQMHEDPQIPNYIDREQPNPLLREGMVLALEPMINIGMADTTVLADNWTVITADKSLSAHFEHTVAITSDGPDILTRLN